MANFNQSPLGQTAVDLLIGSLNLTAGASSSNITSSTTQSSFYGTSGSTSLAPIETGTFDLYPLYRKQIRLIGSTPAT